MGITFKGVDFSSVLDFETPSISGALDLHPAEIATTPLAGRDYQNVRVVRRAPRNITFEAVMSDVDRASFLKQLRYIKRVLSPSAGPGFLTRSDFPGKRILCQSVNLPWDENTLPYLIRGGRFSIEFIPLGHWEDDAPNLMTLAATNLLSDYDASFDSSLSGTPDWRVSAGATVEFDTDIILSDDGSAFMRLETSADGAYTEVTTASAVTAGQSYAVSLRGVTIEAVGTVDIGIRWYGAAGAYISSSYSSKTFVSTWADYSMVATAPVGALTARVTIAQNGDGTREVLIDSVQLELGGAATSFVLESCVVNGGDLPAYPIITCTATNNLPSGLWFQIGTQRFTYTGAITTGQVLVVTTDVPNVTLNGVVAFANTDPTSEFPLLGLGINEITKSSVNFTVGLSWRRQYE